MPYRKRTGKAEGGSAGSASSVSQVEAITATTISFKTTIDLHILLFVELLLPHHRDEANLPRMKVEAPDISVFL